MLINVKLYQFVVFMVQATKWQKKLNLDMQAINEIYTDSDTLMCPQM